MPDDNNEELTPGDLRKQLADTKAALQEMQDKMSNLATENQTLRGSTVLFEAGLGTLNQFQRTAVLNMVGDKELNKENILEVANNLGFKPEAAPPAGDPNNPPVGSNNGNGNIDPNAINFQDPRMQALLTAAMQMDGNPTASPLDALQSLARVNAASKAAGANTNGKSFEERLRETKSPDEIMHLISTEGPLHGMAMESDFD